MSRAQRRVVNWLLAPFWGLGFLWGLAATYFGAGVYDAKVALHRMPEVGRP